MYKIPATTLFLGKDLVFMPECHSTNDLALQLCQQKSVVEGTVIITAKQTAGRGQRGNTWETEPGKNLTFTFIIKPVFLSVTDQFYLNVFTALAVRDYLQERTSRQIQIKWPNDVLIEGKKVCGILIENQLRGNQFINSVIGIGLNINQNKFGVATATSLFLATEKEYVLQAELELLLHKLEARFFQLKQNKFSFLMEHYLSALYWLNEPHTFSSNEKTFEGIITGIAEGGMLKVQTDEGIRTFGVKEISFLC